MRGFKNDMKDKIYGNLKGIKECGKDKYNKILWEFECLLCGKIHITNSTDVKRGKIKSCGCSKNKKDKNGQWKGYEGLYGSTYTHYKKSAKKRKIKFNVSIEYLWNKYIEQGKKCPFTGKNLLISIPESDRSSFKRTPINSSLDRIDSSKGYIEGNVQWVYKPINIMKGELDNKEFLNLCKIIYENNDFS